MGVVHRDIKSSNILLNEPEDGAPYPHPLLADFGLARSAGGDDTLAIAHHRDGISPRYGAPEVFARMHLRRTAGNGGTSSSASSIDDDKRSDVFSLGVTFWEILTRRVPWSNVSTEQVELTVRSGGRLDQLSPRLTASNEGQPIDSVLIALIDACLTTSPPRRPTAASIFSKLEDLVQRENRY